MELDFYNFYCPPDEDMAHEAWNASCGPCAMAAMLGKSLADIAHAFPNQKRQKYASPKDMMAALSVLGVPAELKMKEMDYPSNGFARIQWHGSWLRPGVHPGAAWARTHWIVVHGDAIYDVNCGFWISRENWRSRIAPEIMKFIKGCDGECSVSGVISILQHPKHLGRAVV